MEEIYLPVLSHFQNGNVWTASGGLLRYQLTPGEESITAQVWEGPWCLAESRVEAEKGFPMTEEGLAGLTAWLGEWTACMATRPKRSLMETLEVRDALRAERKAQQEAAAVAATEQTG